jgi:hypothetical protein
MASLSKKRTIIEKLDLEFPAYQYEDWEKYRSLFSPSAVAGSLTSMSIMGYRDWD